MSAINVNNVWTNILDDQTGESVNFEEVTTWLDGTPMDDSKCDGTIYRKLPASVGGGYVKRKYTGPANILWFGVAADGVTDDSSKFQDAVKSCSNLFVPSGVYSIQQPIAIPSNVTIIGEGSSELLASFTLEEGGGYPNTLLTITDSDNIQLNNLILDWGRSVTQHTPSETATTNPGMRIANSSNISFVNCEFKNYITNRNTALTGEDRAMDFVMAGFSDSRLLQIRNCRATYIREEQLTFLNCQQIEIDQFSGDGAGGLSSQLAFWYCDNISISNSIFVQNSGSVINLYSTNVRISNISVNKGAPRWGRGIDIGNELGTNTEFVPGNISIENSYFNCFSYGVATSLGGPEEQIISNVQILNNKFSVNEQTGGGLLGYHRCIIISNPDNWMISGNTATLGATTSSSQGVFVYFSISESDLNLGSVYIQGNSVESNCFVSLPFPTSGNRIFKCKGIYIHNNFFTAIAISAPAPNSGAQQFFYIRSSSTSVGTGSIQLIDIRSNVISGVSGYYFEFMNEAGGVALSIDRTVFDSNMVYPVTGGFLSGNFRTRSTNRTADTLLFTNNVIYKYRGSRLSNYDKIIMRGNVFDYIDENLTSTPFEIEANNTLLDVRSNFFLRLSSSVQTINHIGGAVPAIVSIWDNNGLTLAGSPVFRTNLVNSTNPNGFNVAAPQADSSAADVAGIVAAHNLLLTNLRSSGTISDV